MHRYSIFTLMIEALEIATLLLILKAFFGLGFLKL
jgi:hypothetical protein